MKPVQLRLLKRETQVCEASPVEASPVCWRAWGAVEYVRKAGEVVGFRNASLSDDAILTGERLPVEFFNHEVMGYAGTVEAAASFLSAWGNPLLPDDYYIPEGGSAALDADMLSFWVDLFGGACDGDYSQTITRGFVDGMYPEGVKDLRDFWGAWDLKGRCNFAFGSRHFFKDALASLYEVNNALRLLRDMFGAVLALIDDSIGEANAHGFYDPFNDGFIARNARAACVRLEDLTRYGFSLTLPYETLAPSPYEFVGAICAQFAETVRDPNPWRRCVRCGRLFKYRVNHARRYAPKGDCDSFYCSARCGNAARQTRFRDNAKTPVQGINGRG